MDQQPQVNPEGQGGMPPSGESTDQAPMIKEDVSNSEQASAPQKPMGPILGIVIIVILLILGGFYFWGTQLSDDSQVQDKTEMTAEEIANQEDIVLENLRNQRNSDEISDIEADLNATDLESLDSELDAIDLELNF